MIDKDKQYTTRSGLPVRIYATDCGGPRPVHGAILLDGFWIHLSWFSHGKFEVQRLNDRDLIEVKPRIQHRLWHNIYRDKVSSGYKTLEDAQFWRTKGCIACIEITINCEEGEGL